MSPAPATRSQWLLLAAAFAVSAVILAALHARDLRFPACDVCDATLYGADAASVRRAGLLAPMPSRGLRTIGYPLFLSPLLDPAAARSETGWGYSGHAVAVAQSLLFLAAVGSLYLAVRRRSAAAAGCCLAGLTLNPFVLNYVPLRLTEGLTVSLAVGLSAIAAWCDADTRHPRLRTALVALGCLLVGFAVIVRPANVVLVAAWVAVVARELWAVRRSRLGRAAL